MADHLSDRRAEIEGKDKAAVKALLGDPVQVSHWTNVRPPEGADAAAVAELHGRLLDEIWIYTSGRVHFTMAGTATRVDDRVAHDLPPEENPPLLV